MSEQQFPAGWDEDRVRRVLDHYEHNDEEEQVAEDEAAQRSRTETWVAVPVDLLPAVRELIAQRSGT